MKYFLTVVFVVSMWFAIRLADSAAQTQEISQMLEGLYRNKKVDISELITQSRNFIDSNAIEGQGLVLYSKVALSAHEHFSEQTNITVSEVLDIYKQALIYKPFSSIFWSKYAIYDSQINGLSGETLRAIDNAMKFGQNDYNTLKDLILLSIREWSKFDCTYKELMLQHIYAGLRKNDDILLQWNRTYNHMSIGRYTTRLMNYYQFNGDWAETQVRVCLQRLS